jgi:hypothetical protein
MVVETSIDDATTSVGGGRGERKRQEEARIEKKA